LIPHLPYNSCSAKLVEIIEFLKKKKRRGRGGGGGGGGGGVQ